MFNSGLHLNDVMNEAQRRSSNLTSGSSSESTDSDDESERVFKFYTVQGKSDRKTKSNDFAHKRFEGDFYSRGYSRYGDVDSESTVFKYAGIMGHNGRKKKTYSDSDTIGSSNRYNYRYFKDNFKIKAKSRNYHREDDSETMDAHGEKTRFQGEIRDTTSVNDERNGGTEKHSEEDGKNSERKEFSNESKRDGGKPLVARPIPGPEQE
ncbi:unnamed protein product [Trichobilharzia regenti]|uniref:Btz domain-containing protein n=1 Tax=Trichobilharzia regenti TaxID=157069 RepID=A0A183W2C3_TRIRE|nr:unnamed protein product [Trichobilharzia regenti]VDQ02759.1 unnamed protein product [Trichobilharzia regenti]